jgi:hypothetical protein
MSAAECEDLRNVPYAYSAQNVCSAVINIAISNACWKRGGV